MKGRSRGAGAAGRPGGGGSSSILALRVLCLWVQHYSQRAVPFTPFFLPLLAEQYVCQRKADRDQEEEQEQDEEEEG